MTISTEELITDLRKNANWLEVQMKDLPKTIKLERRAATRLDYMERHLIQIKSLAIQDPDEAPNRYLKAIEAMCREVLGE